MHLQLTPEMQRAVAESGGRPVELADPSTQKRFLLVEVETNRAAKLEAESSKVSSLGAGDVEEIDYFDYDVEEITLFDRP
jgi:hypothetical protein